MVNRYQFLPPHKLYKLLGASRHDIERVESILREYFGKPVVVLNAARTGVYLTLTAKKLKRTDEVLVPPYMPKCMLDTIAECAVPTLHISPATKAILLVHQYGYPQHMDEVLATARKHNLLVIEDSAASFGSMYHGKMVGSWGDVAIFTFPKAFQTILGGCLVTKDEEILNFARAYLKKQDTFMWRCVSTLALIPHIFDVPTVAPWLRRIANHFVLVAYSQFKYFPNANKRVCHLFPKTREDFLCQIETRKRNLAIFKSYFAGTPVYPNEVEADADVVPFFIPYFAGYDLLAHILRILVEHGIESEIYHFDVNRNMFNPHYASSLI
ncbi:MAG TPA: DegT/DnrJ/EryC1/StrS family aminotransferase, partial [Candidatus Paceibacterota bacterium]